jgi:hypothetical protein
LSQGDPFSKEYNACELSCAEFPRREWYQMMDLLFMTPSKPCLGLCLKGTAPKLIVSCVHGTASG